MFNFNYDQVSTGATAAELADGIYEGTIEFSDVKLSQAGVKMINLKMKLANGATLYERLNLENANPTAKTIAQEKAQSIIAFGINKPDGKFTTIESLAAYLKGVPVKIQYKNKGVDDKGYTRYDVKFKPVAAELKVTKTTTASASAY